MSTGHEEGTRIQYNRSAFRKMRLTRRYLVRGRVQGVGFRYFTQAAAARAGIGGWVRNNADGTVEIAASGEPAALATLEADIRRGPPGARVDRVDVSDTPAIEARTEFVIR
jgi:acylphosphatase